MYWEKICLKTFLYHPNEIAKSAIAVGKVPSADSITVSGALTAIAHDFQDTT